MRCRAVWQAERAAHAFHRKLHDTRRERPAFLAAKHRLVFRQVERADRDVIVDRLRNLRDQRHHTGLVALAGDGDGIAGARCGNLAALQGQRFGDAKPGAIQERKHGGVARQHPGFALLIGAGRGIGEGERGLRVQRARQRFRHLRCAHGGERVGLAAAFALEKAHKRTCRCQRALQRSCLDAVCAAEGEERANIGGRKFRKIGEFRFVPEMPGQERKKEADISRVGLAGFRREALFGCDEFEPSLQLDLHVPGGNREKLRFRGIAGVLIFRLAAA